MHFCVVPKILNLYSLSFSVCFSSSLHVSVFIRSSVPMLDSDWLRIEGYMLYLSVQTTKSVSVKQLDRYFPYLYSSDVISRDLPGTPSLSLTSTSKHVNRHWQTGVSSAYLCLSIWVKIKRYAHFSDEKIALKRAAVTPNKKNKDR